MLVDAEKLADYHRHCDALFAAARQAAGDGDWAGAVMRCHLGNARAVMVGADGSLHEWTLQGGFSGSQRTARHLSRMCLAMYMATMSFFIGQARLLPMWMKEARLNLVPVLLVVGALIYFLIRFRLMPAMRKRPS